MKQNQSQLPSLRLICIFQNKKNKNLRSNSKEIQIQRHFLENHTNRNGKSNLLSIGNEKNKTNIKKIKKLSPDAPPNILKQKKNSNSIYKKQTLKQLL